MASTTPSPHPGLMIVHPERRAEVSTGWGWTIFASLMMLLSSGVTGAWGVVAILSHDYWGGDQVVAGHEALWGWLWIGFATFQAAVALGVLVRNAFAVVLGILLAITNVISQVIGFDNYPIWSAVALALNALIIWALVAHGFDRR